MGTTVASEKSVTTLFYIPVSTTTAVSILVVNSVVVSVGAGGFEPPTPATPLQCATGLRYAPTASHYILVPVARVNRPNTPESKTPRPNHLHYPELYPYATGRVMLLKQPNPLHQH